MAANGSRVNGGDTPKGLWADVVKEVKQRQAALEALGVPQAEANSRAPEVTIVNLFVEKAVILLRRRARASFAWAVFCIVVALAVALVYLAYAVVSYDPHVVALIQSRLLHAEIAPYMIQNPGAGEVFLIALRIGGVSTAAFGTAWVLFHLANSFFHEWAKLNNQQHAIRFGRLVYYLKPDGMSAEDFMRVFSWNMDSTSGFIRRLGRNPYGGSSTGIPQSLDGGRSEKKQ